VNVHGLRKAGRVNGRGLVMLMTHFLSKAELCFMDHNGFGFYREGLSLSIQAAS